MEEKSNQLSERLIDYGAGIICLTTSLRKTASGRLIANQLLRSSTSAGANYEEACGAQTKADFIHKLHIVYKELRESLYWLKLIKRSELLKNHVLNNIITETNHLNNIISSSLLTAKKNNSKL